MTYGPCGGVGFDGACELGTEPCVFLHGGPVPWRATATAAPAPVTADPLEVLARQRAVVVSDLPVAGIDADAVRGAAGALAGHVDAVLFGDTGYARVQLPPSYRARLVAAEGVRPWAGVNCRDRNRVALEGELLALADVGAAVHCITGDHPAIGHRADAKPVFDLDSTELVALASQLGLFTSVAENPVAPPIAMRPGRLAEKVRAGARSCIVNHSGSAATVAEFVDRARGLGAVDTSFFVCVPVVFDAASIAGLRTFTTLALPDGLLAAVEAAPDPFMEGVRRAVAFARDVLDVPGVSGVDLSVAVAGANRDAVRAIRTIAKELRPC
jgi:methylenetetrahydrofolate reductase (NADPH)